MTHNTQLMTESDVAVLNKRIRGSYVTIVFVAIVVFVVLTVVSQSKHAWNHIGFVWVTFFLVMAIFIGAMWYLVLRKIKQDQKELMKVCGKFKIGKFVEQGKYVSHYYFTVDIAGKQKKILIKQDLYNATLSGEMVYLEFAPYSGTPLRLMKNGQEVSL